MPDHGYDRCDGRHEMVDSIFPEGLGPGHRLMKQHTLAPGFIAPCLTAGFRVAAGKDNGEPGMSTLNCVGCAPLLNTATERQRAILGWLEAQAAYASIQNISGLPQGLASRTTAG
jgi:hypothetical protein